MRLNESRLRAIIKEEYERVTPTPPGRLMTEARARYLAEEIMNEGFFSSLFQGVKAVGAGLKAAGSEAGKQVGDAGGALGASFIAAAQKVAAPIKQASDAAKESIANIADKGLKAAAASSAKSIKDSLQPIIIDQLTTLVKKFQAAGSSEEQAKEQARGIVQAAVITAIGY